MTLFEKMKEERNRLRTIDPTKFTVTETGQIIRPSKKHVSLCIEKAGIQEDVISLRIKNEALKAEIAEQKAQIESMKETLEQIRWETNEHGTHNMAENELLKWGYIDG